MNSLGIYFGIKEIILVETSGKKIVNNIRLPHPSLAMAELEEKVPADIKLMAMLKDAFRSNRISAEEAFFCLSGQDLVIRTFEIPLLPQSELRGAVNFEAKKYIPFKLEELYYDFQALFNKKDKTSLILFVGIKKETLVNYVSIAKQLNLKIGMLEYSAFSILRFLKLAGLSDAGVMATLCFDLNNEDEANFTVFENGFSLFSRDFVFSAEPGGFEQTVDTDLAQKKEKIKNEIKVSLDYYNRKFPEKTIKNIFVLSNKETQGDLGSFFTDTSIPYRAVETQKVIGKGVDFSSAVIKSFSASLSKIAPIKIKINLNSARLKTEIINKSSLPAVDFAALLQGIKIDFKFIVLGIIVCAAVFGYGLMRIQPMQEELDKIKSKRVRIISSVAGDSLEELSALSDQYRGKIRKLDKLVKDQMYATYPLNAIPAALPGGVWLENFRLTQNSGNVIELSLTGQVYLEDHDREFESVNIFLINLKNNPEFSKYFKEININSIDQKLIDNKSVTVFSITCKNLAEKK